MTLAKLGGCLAITAAAAVFGTAIWFGKVNVVEVVGIAAAWTHQETPLRDAPAAGQSKRANTR